jgi:hypothetical protein
MSGLNPVLVKKFGLSSPDDALPACVWPGGYPVFYLDRGWQELCPACANQHRDEILDGDVYWEGPAMSCSECGVEIVSAYGNPFCSCGSVLPTDPVEVNGVAYCDKCASLCVLCETGCLIDGGMILVDDPDTGMRDLVCLECAGLAVAAVEGAEVCCDHV